MRIYQNLARGAGSHDQCVRQSKSARTDQALSISRNSRKLSRYEPTHNRLATVQVVMSKKGGFLIP